MGDDDYAAATARRGMMEVSARPHGVVAHTFHHLFIRVPSNAVRQG